MPHAFDERFRRVCRDRRWRPAVHDLAEGRSLTFADIDEQHGLLAQALERLGIGDGATVVSLVGNRPVFFPLLAACMTVGAALLPLGETTDGEALDVIARAAAAAVVTDRRLPLDAAADAPLGDGVRILQLAARAPRRFGEAVVLKLTSGSTDVPKAAVAHIDHLVHDGDHVIEAMGIAPSDVNLACIPLSHSYALGNIVMPLLLQGTAAVLRQSFHPIQWLSDAEATGATVFPGVPFMFDRFRAMGIERWPSRLRLLVTAGARIQPETVRWFRDALGRKVHSFYGSSETGGISYDDSDEVDDPLHVGRPMPGTFVEIREPDAAGAGRVFVAGSAVASGYADLRAGGGEAGFVDGGFVTGDIGRFDAAGRLVLTGRVSPLVNVAGLKVDPAEVERVILELPGVAGVRVLAASCSRRGQQLVAFVVSDRPMTPMDLRRRCARRLSPHKIPRRFIFLDAFPVDARGKTDRRALEALAADGAS